MVGCSKNTVQKLLLDLGTACSEFMDKKLRDLPCKRVHVDEIWSFVYAKTKNVPADKRGQFGVGDVWTFTAIDADTKLIPCFLVGPRDGGSAAAEALPSSSRTWRAALAPASSSPPMGTSCTWRRSGPASAPESTAPCSRRSTAARP